jgi:hypothetical protein
MRLHRSWYLDALTLAVALFQVQPLLRQCYSEPSFDVREAADLDAEHWQRFAATMRPNTDQMRALGHYAVDARRRLRGSKR